MVKVGDRATGICRSLRIRMSGTVVRVNKDTWPGAYGFTAVIEDEIGRQWYCNAEECEVIA